MILTKEEILKNRPAIFKVVPCPSLGGDVKIKAMSASTKDLFEQRYASLEEVNGVTENIRACFLVHSIVDEDNKLMFTMDDLELLGSQDGKDLDKLFTVARELSGFSSDDEDEVKLKKK